MYKNINTFTDKTSVDCKEEHPIYILNLLVIYLLYYIVYTYLL